MDQHNLAKMIWNLYKNCPQSNAVPDPGLSAYPIGSSPEGITFKTCQGEQKSNRQGAPTNPHLFVKFFFFLGGGGGGKKSLTELKMILDFFLLAVKRVFVSLLVASDPGSA